MAEYFTWARLAGAGGPTLYILILCFLLSLIIIIERIWYFNSRRLDSRYLQDLVFRGIEDADIAALRARLGEENSPMAYVLEQCLELDEMGGGGELFEEVKSRAIAEKVPEMERFLNIEATLGTVSPFIGLLGTVLGIVRAFQGLGAGASKTVQGAAQSLQGGAGGMSELNAGIAAALVATAAGLIVAIPSTVAYNYFRRRVNALIMDTEVAASRLKVLLSLKSGNGTGA